MRGLLSEDCIAISTPTSFQKQIVCNTSAQTCTGMPQLRLEVSNAKQLQLPYTHVHRDSVQSEKQLVSHVYKESPCLS